MHLLTFSRAMINRTMDWAHDLNALPVNYAGMQTQVKCNPIMLWDIIFPKEYMPTMVKTICGENWINPPMAPVLRKALGAKKIPKLDLSTAQEFVLKKEFVSTYPIGIKEDKDWPEGHFMAGKEQL